MALKSGVSLFPPIQFLSGGAQPTVGQLLWVAAQKPCTPWNTGENRKVITSNVEDPLVDKMLEAWDPTGTQAGVGQRSGYLGGYRGELPAANGRSGPVLTCVDLRRLVVQWVAPCVGLQRNRQQERIRPRAIQASPLLTHPTLWNFHV